jgi:hypothetical protein
MKLVISILNFKHDQSIIIFFLLIKIKIKFKKRFKICLFKKFIQKIVLIVVA